MKKMKNYVKRTSHEQDQGRKLGDVAALVRSHMNGLQPFKRTNRTNNRHNAANPKTVTAATMTKQ